MSFNFFNFLILIGAIQGFVFSGIILNKHKTNSNRYLALVVLFLSLNNLYYTFIDAKIENYFPNFSLFYIPFKLLVLPTFYKFVLKYLRLEFKSKFLKKLLYFPFYVFFLLYVIKSLLKFTLLRKVKYFENVLYYSEEYFSVIFSVFIIYKSYIVLNNYKNITKGYKKENLRVNTKWLKKLLVFGLSICFIWGAVVIRNQFINQDLYSNYNRYFIWVSVTFLIYWIAYLGIYYNGIFNERKELRKKISKNNTKKVKENDSEDSKIKNLIRSKKLYLNPKLSLQDIADILHLNVSYTSHSFNKSSKLSFPQYVNRLRIKHAKNILLDEEFKNYTLVSIALESGFNSKSAFYTAFKKETGLTPTEFRKQHLS